jgi:hypothetical protein
MKSTFLIFSILSLLIQNQAIAGLGGKWEECSVSFGSSLNRTFSFDTADILRETIIVRNENDGCEAGRILIEINRFYNLKMSSTKIGMKHFSDTYVIRDEEEALKQSRKNLCGVSDWHVNEYNMCAGEENYTGITIVHSYDASKDELLLISPDKKVVHRLSKVTVRN